MTRQPTSFDVTAIKDFLQWARFSRDGYESPCEETLRYISCLEDVRDAAANMDLDDYGDTETVRSMARDALKALEGEGE